MLDPYRLACPNGKHRRLTPRQKGGFYCEVCNTYYPEVKDLKTGLMVSSSPQLSG